MVWSLVTNDDLVGHKTGEKLFLDWRLSSWLVILLVVLHDVLVAVAAAAAVVVRP